MGSVYMCVVQSPDCIRTLQEYQSNAKIVMKTIEKDGHLQMEDQFSETLRHELNIYIMYCILKFMQISNIKNYMDLHEQMKPDMQDSIIRMIADDFVEKELDVIQSSIMMLENLSDMGKVEFYNFQRHVQEICMARSSLFDGGITCAWRALDELNKLDYGFRFAKGLKVQTDALEALMLENSDVDFRTSFSSDNNSPIDSHACHLIDELTSFDSGNDPKRISLVLVKQRSTAYHLSTLLEV